MPALARASRGSRGTGVQMTGLAWGQAGLGMERLGSWSAWGQVLHYGTLITHSQLKSNPNSIQTLLN